MLVHLSVNGPVALFRETSVMTSLTPEDSTSMKIIHSYAMHKEYVSGHCIAE